MLQMISYDLLKPFISIERFTYYYNMRSPLTTRKQTRDESREGKENNKEIASWNRAANKRAHTRIVRYLCCVANVKRATSAVRHRQPVAAAPKTKCNRVTTLWNVPSRSTNHLADTSHQFLAEFINSTVFTFLVFEFSDAS